ncbi:hypothetical protein ACLOJK_015385 [Asimina triloba]
MKVVWEKQWLLKLLLLLLRLKKQTSSLGWTTMSSKFGIVGMGGVGKTTLAKKAYEIIENDMHFQCFSWVHVSQSSLDDKYILKCMLEGFHKSVRDQTPPSDGEVTMLNEEELRKSISSCLQGKRYALVLDDVWDIHVWEYVKPCFPSEGGGRIILPTCDEERASPVSERCHVHRLKPLPDGLAW